MRFVEVTEKYKRMMTTTLTGCPCKNFTNEVANEISNDGTNKEESTTRMHAVICMCSDMSWQMSGICSDMSWQMSCHMQWFSWQM